MRLVKLSLGFALAACAAAPSAAAGEQPAQADVTAFVDVSVIPMDSDRVLTGHTVVVRGDRIVAVGPAADLNVPVGAHRIDRSRIHLPYALYGIPVAFTEHVEGNRVAESARDRLLRPRRTPMKVAKGRLRQRPNDNCGAGLTQL